MQATPPGEGPDRYRWLQALGEGAMGRVWLARDTVLDRDVALKEPKGGASSPAAKRLEREARVLSRLDHPGIAALLDQGHLADGRPFFVMRQATGPDLGRWCRGGRRSPVAEPAPVDLPWRGGSTRPQPTDAAWCIGT